MTENTNMSEVIEEIKSASEEELRKVIEGWYETTYTDGLRKGAYLIASAVMGKMQKHLDKPGKLSLRDHERCIADIKKMLVVQLTQQNDLEEGSEEIADDEQ